MGTMPSAVSLADALFSPVQKRVLGLVFGQPGRRYQSAEIIRLADGGVGAVHRVLRKLASAGLVTVTRIGNQVHYQANADSPVFSELHGLVVKTVAVVEPLRQALAALSPAIDAAFVYGSVAKGTDKAESDIDLMVVSDEAGYAEIYAALQPAEESLGRPVNPNVLTRSEWRTRRAQPESFVSQVAEGPVVFVVGGDDALA